MIDHYWGKADPKYTGEQKWHPLAYHCLDVAAVAATWWDSNPALLDKFCIAFTCSVNELPRLRAWVLFFVALHDLDKFDLRFQLKAPEVFPALAKMIRATTMIKGQLGGFSAQGLSCYVLSNGRLICPANQITLHFLARFLR